MPGNAPAKFSTVDMQTHDTDHAVQKLAAE